MLRFVKGILAALMLAVVASACERAEVQPAQTGYLYIDLQQDFSVDPVFKSEAAEDMTFSLVIYDSNDQVVATYDDHRDLEAEPIELRVGRYRLRQVRLRLTRRSTAERLR